MSLFLLIGIAVCAMAIMPTMFVVTRQQTVRIVETFGKFSDVKGAGLGIKLPWPIQTISAPLSLRVREISEDVTVKSSDNAFLTIPIRVQYRVDEMRARDAWYKLSSPEDQIRSYVLNQIRSTASNTPFDDLFQARNNFESDVADTLHAKMGTFGFIIENVLVDDPQPSMELRQAFDRVIASQRLREAASNEGEAQRIRSVAAATAEGESLKIKAEAYANFRNIVARGNAEALESFCGKTSIPETSALDFFTSINEFEAIRDAASAGGRIVFVSSGGHHGARDPGGQNDHRALMGLIESRFPDPAESEKGASPLAPEDPRDPIS